MKITRTDAPRTKNKHSIECILVLHDIRSTHNVGALFRTADAIGVSEIILSGTSPAPIDRFGRKRSDIVKSALGAEETVPWKQTDKIVEVLKKFKEDGYTLYAIEQANNSIDYKAVTIKKGSKIVVIPGYEVSGVPAELLELADYVLEIPMYGKKESLNVSVATGIVLYRLLDH